MSNVTAHEISSLFQDEEFVNAVIEQAVEQPEVMENLAEEIAGELSDMMEDDPQLQRRLVSQALKTDGFKQQVIENLIAEISD